MRGTYEGDDWTNVIIPGDQSHTGIQTQVEVSVYFKVKYLCICE